MSDSKREKPKTIVRKDSSVIISFENVFPKAAEDSRCIIILQMLNNILEWQEIYQGKLLVHCVNGLPPSTPFNFRVRAVYTGNATDWLEFSSATATEQFYVRHLTRAIEFNKIPLIRKIMSFRSTLLNVENHENKTPLVQAVENGNLKLVNFLVISGANVNQKMKVTMKTALLMAFLNGNLNIIQYLLTKKADITSADINGLNGLHYAIDSNNTETVKFAIDAGINLNQKDSKGWTPLLRAVIMETTDDIIKLLLESGADVNIQDNKGISFMKHATLAGRTFVHQKNN